MKGGRREVECGEGVTECPLAAAATQAEIWAKIW
jgi:hypothetical protein